MRAVEELRKFNDAYVPQHKHLEDNFEPDPYKAPSPDDPVVKILTVAYLRALNRRGLVGL